ncbi:MAG: hypothetical protein GXY19_16030 [Phycisphaerae bacterium]|nr:hypothetical protein [Phycisphaerae bacterium]
MGLLQILSSPATMKLGLAASGVECARVDYDRRTDEVVLSIVVADRVHHYRLPCKCTFTRDEIAAWLTGETYLSEQAPRDPAEIHTAP